MTSIQVNRVQQGSERPRATAVEPQGERLMRLLFLSIAFPFPATNGLTMRTLSLLKILAKLGHEIHLVAFGGGEPTNAPEIRQTCRTVRVVEQNFDSLSARGQYWLRLRLLPSPLPYGVLRYRSRAMENTIRDLLQVEPVDAIVCDMIDSLINLPKDPPVPVIIASPDVQYLILKRYLSYERNPARWSYTWLESEKVKTWERSACSRADLVMVCSEHDKSIIEEICPRSSVSVVPNTIDVDEYIPDPDQDATRVVYTGGMDWYPNRDAVQFFVSSILPELRKIVPEVRFVVAGRSPSEEFRRRFAAVPGVEFTGTVTDIRPEIARASVCVVPLRIGSGTRLKILEAAAMARPVVSTRLGAEGLEFADGREIFLADQPAEFAKSVANLLRDSSLRSSVGRAARRRVETDYSSPVLEAAIRSALSGLEPNRAVLTDSSEAIRMGMQN
jgi:glycosyltransferase involved in cell wall biosynthesis